MPAPDNRKLHELERAVQKRLEDTFVFAFTPDRVTLVIAALMGMCTGHDYGFKRDERQAAGDLAEEIARAFIRSFPPEERAQLA